MDDLNVAVICMRAEVGEIRKNLEKMEAFVAEASASSADIICFPELSITGYTLKAPENTCTSAEARESMDCVAAMAKKAGSVVLAGVIEPSMGQKPYITQIIAGPQGLIGLYRKTHLSPFEKDLFSQGQEIGVFTWGLTTFGLQLCYEAHFPEVSTIMALMDAEIFFMPHASPKGDPAGKLESWIRHLRARAFDNGAYVVACNQVGENEEGYFFPGVGLILDPTGRIQAQYTGEKENMLFASLEARNLLEIRRHRMKYFIPNRRPELYGKIARVEKDPGWNDGAGK